MRTGTAVHLVGNNKVAGGDWLNYNNHAVILGVDKACRRTGNVHIIVVGDFGRETIVRFVRIRRAEHIHTLNGIAYGVDLCGDFGSTVTKI